eukprot:6410921-Prymnesium_polylepis.1
MQPVIRRVYWKPAVNPDPSKLRSAVLFVIESSVKNVLVDVLDTPGRRLIAVLFHSNTMVKTDASKHVGREATELMLSDEVDRRYRKVGACPDAHVHGKCLRWFGGEMRSTWQQTPVSASAPYVHVACACARGMWHVHNTWHNTDSGTHLDGDGRYRECRPLDRPGNDRALDAQKVHHL